MLNHLTLRWKEILIGVLGACLAYSISRVVSDAIAFRDKLASFPDPAVIVTKNLIDERIAVLSQRIDDNNRDTKDGLRRIEGKLDSLTLALAVRREELKKQTSIFPPMVSPPAHYTTPSESRLRAN